MNLAATVLLVSCLLGCFDEAATPAPRARDYPWMTIEGWYQFHESFRKRAQEGPVDILFLGDSITQSWSREGKAIWEERYAPRAAANFGIGGDMTQELLWRITEGKELEGMQPRVCVLLIGTNNFGAKNHAPESVVKGIQTTVEAIQERLPETRIILMEILPRDEQPDTPLRRSITEANRLLQSLESPDRVKLLSLSSKFLKDDGTLDPQLMPDFLHLSEQGYRIWADALDPVLDEWARVKK